MAALFLVPFFLFSRAKPGRLNADNLHVNLASIFVLQGGY
jgi:hypothetical protein